MYHPMLIFERHTGCLLAARLRPGNASSHARIVPMLLRLVPRLQAAFPSVKIKLRGDAGFALPLLYRFCEFFHLEYALGIPANCVFKRRAEPRQKQLHRRVNGTLLGNLTLDPSQPQALIYEPSNGKMTLVGVEFILDSASWLAANNNTPPVLDGQVFNFVGAPNRFNIPSFFELHVWAWRDQINLIRLRGYAKRPGYHPRRPYTRRRRGLLGRTSPYRAGVPLCRASTLCWRGPGRIFKYLHDLRHSVLCAPVEKAFPRRNAALVSKEVPHAVTHHYPEQHAKCEKSKIEAIRFDMH
jgi:hypothetical protein